MTGRSDPLWRVVLAGVFVFLYLPIAVLVGLSFNASDLPTVWTGLSLRWYAVLLTDAQVLGAARNSLVVGLVSGLLSTLLGTALALGMERARRRGALEAMVLAPMIIPDIVLAIALLSFFSLLQLPMGLATIIAAHAVFGLAFVCSVVRARLRSFDWTLLEAARDLGATPGVAFRRVTLPLILPAVVAGGLLAFTLSLDEFIIAFFTAGPGSGSTTLPMQIFAMLRFGVTPQINALSTLVMAASLVTLIVVQRLNRGLPGT